MTRSALDCWMPTPQRPEPLRGHWCHATVFDAQRGDHPCMNRKTTTRPMNLGGDKVEHRPCCGIHRIKYDRALAAESTQRSR